nr:hypothetical protein [Tanacetum cinerariifolium]
AINSIIKSRDAIFYEHRFLSVPRPSQRSLEDGTGNSSGLVVFERVTEEVVLQPESKLRKSKRHRTPKDFRPEFQLYLIEGTRDDMSNQHSYCFNVEDDLKTFDEAMKSHDVAFWKEAINDENDFIMGNNTWVLIDLPPGYRPLGCKWTFKRKLKMDVKIAFLNEEQEEEAPKQRHQKFDEVVLSNGYLLSQPDKCVYSKFNKFSKGVIICLYVDNMLIFGTNQVQVDLTKEFVSSRFSMKDMGEADVILGIRIKHKSNGIVISQSHYIKKVLKKFIYFDCTLVSNPLDTCEKPDIAFDVGKLSRMVYSGYPLVLESYTDASWISNLEDNSSTSGWVFLLGGAAGKEAEWLKYLFFEIPLWYKPMIPIFIYCDSAATLAKAYSQMYNEKYRHLGVRHNMIRELIMNGWISIEFVRSQPKPSWSLDEGSL